MQNNLPIISIIIPCRNEENFIGKCLDSVLSSDYPKEKLKILLIDGMSEDRTREIIEEYIQQHTFIRLLDNPKKITPVAFNIGIKHAMGEIILIMSAHASYEKDYISKCVYYLNKLNADNVGGILKTLSGDNTRIAKAISLILSHPFGVGNSRFRIGIKEPMVVDTIPFGCYRREIFDKIGLFNEELSRSQDYEFNLRLKRWGGKIMLLPDIVSYYYARSTLKSLAKNSFWTGYWVIYSTKFAKTSFLSRHLIPLVFVTTTFGSLFLSKIYLPFIYLFILVSSSYIIVNILFSFRISIQKNMKLFPALIISFFTLHFWYGIGSIWGLIKLFISKYL